MATLDDASCRPLKASEFAKIRQLAYSAFGLDLRAGKETLVSARLGKDIRKSGFRSFDEYYQHVVEDCTGEALIQLIDSLTTNHTAFFREPAHFDFLRKSCCRSGSTADRLRSGVRRALPAKSRTRSQCASWKSLAPPHMAGFGFWRQTSRAVC